jgi:4-amino-4-deoxy-L-arabinose transferase-like glycosyltransferase
LGSVNRAPIGALLNDRTRATAVLAALAVLFIARVAVAAMAPLTFDEGLYWVWSKNLAGGYLDHPPMIPIVIRLGTSLFGDTEFGVRSIGVLLSVPATWAVWRSAAILFHDNETGAAAALFFTLTLVIAAGSVLVTQDNPLVVATAFLLFFLAKLLDTGRRAWWLAIGVAFGLGMLSKYTMIFFAVSILVWVLWVPELRKQLLTPWPWVSGLIAVAVFSPTLIWNAEHGWVSMLYQSRRLAVHEWTLRYFGDFVGSQIGIATPPVFVLGWMGLAGFLRRGGERPAARVLISAMVWPLAAYFLWHSLHGRVEGNWPEPLYAAFAIAAAVAACDPKWSGGWRTAALWSRRLAAPLGIAGAAVIYLQAVFGIVPLGRIDPTARLLGAGWTDLGPAIDQIRERIRAPVILTMDYGLTGWLAFYVPSRPPVVQLNVRTRYVDAPPPDPALFRGPMLFVCDDPCYEAAILREHFRTVEAITTVTRSRHGVPINSYGLYKLEGPIGSVLAPY